VAENSSGAKAQLRTALDEMQLYLSDSIPPLFFADSVRLLLEAPPEIVGAQVVAWATIQVNPGAQLPTADYIFHAAKKLHMLAELELLPADVVKAWIGSLRPSLIEGCPASDRKSLIADLERLDIDITLSPTSGVEVVYRRTPDEKATERPRRAQQAEGEAIASESLEDVSRNVDQGLRRLDTLLQKLELAEAHIPSTEAPSSQSRRLAADVVAQATEGAENAEELESFLSELRNRGLPATPDGLLGLLAQNLPDWAPPPADAGDTGEAPQAAVRAMHRFISMAENREEGQKRFDELVSTAVDEFNRGSLGRAVTLLDLANQMIEKKEIDGVLSESVQRRTHGAIDRGRLFQMVDEDENAHLLRRFLSFFPLLSPPQLLEDLEAEEDREQRRHILDLLRIHGADARSAAFADLVKTATGEASFPWYYLRNLIHLLRTIPRGQDDPIDPEIDVLVPMSDIKGEYPLVREALSSLGQLHHERAVTALSARASEIESALIDKGDRQYDSEQMYYLLDSTIKALVRMDMPDARRAVVAHGLKRKPELGDTLKRLTWLESQDLSGEADAVERLVREVRNEMPKKVFGVSLGTGKRAQAVEWMLKALSGTDTPAVRSLLQEISRDSADQPWAGPAGKMLRGFERADEGTDSPKEESTATLSGDLKLFGLPNLLQNLADSQIAGVLRVFDSDGSTEAELWLDQGKVIGARSGRLAGEVAVYQLLEDPTPGRFVLDQLEVPPENSRTGQDPMSIQSILFEGIRRYDEFKRAASIAPDDAHFRSTGKQPTMGEDETDPEIFREVWRRAAAGRSPKETESEVLVDRYRVRVLFEHWVSAGILESAEPDPDSKSSKP
jgi:hypothetical protein